MCVYVCIYIYESALQDFLCYLKKGEKLPFWDRDATHRGAFSHFFSKISVKFYSIRFIDSETNSTASFSCRFSFSKLFSSDETEEFLTMRGTTLEERGIPPYGIVFILPFTPLLYVLMKFPFVGSKTGRSYIYISKIILYYWNFKFLEIISNDIKYLLIYQDVLNFFNRNYIRN